MISETYEREKESLRKRLIKQGMQAAILVILTEILVKTSVRSQWYLCNCPGFPGRFFFFVSESHCLMERRQFQLSFPWFNMQGVLINACCSDTSTDFTKKKVFDIFSGRSLPVMNLGTAFVSVNRTSWHFSYILYWSVFWGSQRREITFLKRLVKLK